MNMPGFDAERSLYSTTYRWHRASKDPQPRNAVVPALHTESWYSCYSRADGDTGWCGTICDDDDCYNVVD